jgi:hypothetical protein
MRWKGVRRRQGNWWRWWIVYDVDKIGVLVIG